MGRQSGELNLGMVFMSMMRKEIFVKYCKVILIPFQN